jgi:hypothetical protein
MHSDRSHNRTGLGLKWLLLNIVGFTIGGALSGGIQRARMQQYFEVVTSATEAIRVETPTTTLTMAVFGAVVGCAQWLVLHRVISAVWWAPATCLGWTLCGVTSGVLSGALGGRVSTIGPDVPVWIIVVVGGPAGALCGLLPGAFQWLVLRRRGSGAGWWPLVSLCGLFAGLAGGFLVVRWGLVDVVHWLTPEDFPSAKALVLVGAVTGLLYAAVTWPLLSRLVARDRHEPSASQGRRPRSGARPARLGG